MINIILSGVGHLGGRHLQALALYPEKLTIYLMDPNESNVVRGTKWFIENDQYHNKHIVHVSQFIDLPKEATLLIVATDSRHRFQATKEILNHTLVTYVILEKFLFNHLTEYDLMDTTLVDIDSFVNCSRRMWPTYQDFKNRIDLSYPVHLKVSGTNYGIAGNAVHYFDLYSFLTGHTDFDIDVTDIHQVISNKRQGYVEFLGSIRGNIQGDTVLQITDYANSETKEVQIELQIKNGPMTYRINELEESMTILENGRIINVEKFTMYHQSVMTAEILKQLLERDTCHLVSYSESSRIHQKLLRSYQAKLKEFGIEGMFT